MRETFWYLASPYSVYRFGLEAAFILAAQQRGLLLTAGVAVFSPIVHSHPIAMICNIDPLDHSIWLPSERPILDSASGLIMLKAEGWEKSFGMNKEREAFELAGKPIIYMDLNIIPPELIK
jgi:hypothetical protein